MKPVEFGPSLYLPKCGNDISISCSPGAVELIFHYSHKGVYCFTWIAGSGIFFLCDAVWRSCPFCRFVGFTKMQDLDWSRGGVRPSQLLVLPEVASKGRANEVQPGSMPQHFLSCRGVSHQSSSMTARAFPISALCHCHIQYVAFKYIRRWLSTSLNLACFT